MTYKYFLLELSKIILMIVNIHYFLNFNDFLLFSLIHHIIYLFYIDNNNNIKFNKENLFSGEQLLNILINYAIYDILSNHKLFKDILKDLRLNNNNIFSHLYQKTSDEDFKYIRRLAIKD